MAISESEKVIRTLYQITTETHKGFEHQVSRLLKLGCDRFNLDIGILAKIDRQTNKYTLVQTIAPKQLPLRKGEVFDFKKTFCAMTVAADQPVGFEHVSTSSLKFHPAFDYFPLEAYIGAPVKVNNTVYGCLSFSSLQPAKQKFSEIDVDALQLMAAWVGAELLHIENSARLEEANRQLTALANTDPLTGLNNRRAFQGFFERFVRHARRMDMPVSVIMIDVDNFKQFNDSYGHIAGDEVLKQVAQLLERTCRESDFVARYGGEEFIILLPNTHADGAKILAENIRSQFLATNWKHRAVTASMGISAADYQTIQDLSPEQLRQQVIEQADRALYYSKETGRNRVSLFTDIARNDQG